MKLILEFKKQFSLREWLSAMKQAVKELLPQLSIKEWLHAFFCYIPTAHAKRVKGGYKTAYQGGTSTEIYNALVITKNSFKNESTI